METLLFSKEDFKAPYPALPPSLDAERIESAMLRAQRRLKPILGLLLYTELVLRVEAEQAAIDARKKALAATPSLPAADLPLLAPLVGSWQKLRDMILPGLIYASLAQYLPFSQTTPTSHGWVRKTDKSSEPIDSRTLAQQASIYDGEALSYEAELRTWLITVGAVDFLGFYPPASHCGTGPESPRTPTVVVQAIGPPDHYDPYHYDPHRRR